MKKENSFSDRLKEIRGKDSFRTLAGKCGGLNESSLRQYEKGLSEPTRPVLEKIANACNVTVGWLANGEEPMRPQAEQEVDKVERARKMREELSASVKGENKKIKATIERGSGKIFEKIQQDEGSSEETFSIADMLSATARVLESKTVYRSALASNIRAFDKAVEMENNVENLNEKIDRMEKMLEQLIRAQATETGDTKKRDEAANS